MDYEVWRLIGSEQVGGFAPVFVSDQAMYNRIERAATSLQTSRTCRRRRITVWYLLCVNWFLWKLVWQTPRFF